MGKIPNSKILAGLTFFLVIFISSFSLLTLAQVDNEIPKPSITINKPSEGATVPVGVYTIKATIYDPVGVTRGNIHATLDNRSVVHDVYYLSIEKPAVALVEVSEDISEGVHVFVITAKNTLGGVSSATVSFRASRAAPPVDVDNYYTSILKNPGNPDNNIPSVIVVSELPEALLTEYYFTVELSVDKKEYAPSSMVRSIITVKNKTDALLVERYIIALEDAYNYVVILAQPKTTTTETATIIAPSTTGTKTVRLYTDKGSPITSTQLTVVAPAVSPFPIELTIMWVLAAVIIFVAAIIIFRKIHPRILPPEEMPLEK